MKAITEVDLRQAEREERVLAESYYKGLIDFTKWTSTLAIAGVLWVGSTITRTMGLSQALVIASSVFLIISLLLAIWLMRRVLEAWGREWMRATEEYTLLLLKKVKAFEPEKVTEVKEGAQIDRLLSAIDATREFSRPSGFNAIATCHVAFLVMGLVLYVVAQVLTIF